MIKKPLVYSISMVGVVSMALAGAASARSVDAATGTTRIGANASCFDVDFSTGAVSSTCFADFLIPLTTDSAGSKNLTFTSRATSAGALCRAVANNRFGTSISASAFLAVPVSATFVSQTLAAVTVPAQGVFFADCITNPGTSLDEFDYVP